MVLALRVVFALATAHPLPHVCVRVRRCMRACSVKEKKGLLVAYHVLHDDGAAVMNYERFAEFVKHLPRVNVRSVAAAVVK